MSLNPLMVVNASREIEYIRDLILSYSNSILCGGFANRMCTVETLNSLETMYLRFMSLNKMCLNGVQPEITKSLYTEITALTYELNQYQVREQGFLNRLESWRIRFVKTISF
jgi:hypothetical protein